MKSKVPVFIGAGVVVALVIAVACLMLRANRTPVVAFLGIPDRERTIFEAQIGNRAEYRVFDTQTSLYYQVQQGRKPDIIITTAGVYAQAAQEQAERNAVLPETLFAEMTSSVRNAVIKNEQGKPVAASLLSSHLGIGIQMDLLRKSDTQTIATWQDIETFARSVRLRHNACIAFAGKDSATVLDIIGGLTESLSGKTQYDAAVALVKEVLADNALRERAFNAQDLADQLASQADSPLYDAIALLKKWYKENLINREVFSMDKDALVSYMRAQLASVVFLDLSEYRSIDYSVVEPYTTIYFPSEIIAASRNFTAPIRYAVRFTKNRKAARLISQLVSTDEQKALSHATGLAPVLANCPTPDRQADDARYWVAATSTPLAGLSRELPLTDEQQKALAIALGTLIQR